MSPFMGIIVLAVLIGVGVFVVGLLTRKRYLILIGAPAVVCIGGWFVLASLRPNPGKEFDRLFGAENRDAASEIQTIKPTLMDGHFISFRMRSADFDTRIRPQFSQIKLSSSTQFLMREPLPEDWPAAVQSARSALRREVHGDDVYLIYFPNEGKAYAAVHYECW